VNALARETGLPKQTVSERMRKGQTVDQIRIYAAALGRSPKNGFPHVVAPPGSPESPEAAGAYELIVRGRQRLEAIDDAKLRRARALAERSELENALRRGELMPVSYIRTWGSRFLTDARDTLLTGPSELADVLAAETDPLKTAAILRNWLERVMAKLHQLDQLWGVEGEDRSSTS
jgi:hypothetical protein